MMSSIYWDLVEVCWRFEGCTVPPPQGIACLVYSSTLKERPYGSQVSFYKTTRRYIPEDDHETKTQLNSVAFSPQANYTDKATVACRRS
jgi:hypothetical protein